MRIIKCPGALAHLGPALLNPFITSFRLNPDDGLSYLALNEIKSSVVMVSRFDVCN